MTGFSEPKDLTLDEVIMDQVVEFLRQGGEAKFLEIPEVHKRRIIDMWNRDMMSKYDPSLPIGRSSFMGLDVIWTPENRGILVSDGLKD